MTSFVEVIFLKCIWKGRLQYKTSDKSNKSQHDYLTQMKMSEHSGETNG